MTTYRLHYFPESGNSYKLALMLTLCGQSFEPVWTDFGGGVTRKEEWRRTVNEMGEIPVLEEDGIPVAYVQFGPLSAYPRALRTRELYPRLPSAPLPAVITCISTTAEGRGRGHAAALVTAVCDDLAARGFAAVEVYPEVGPRLEATSAAGPGFWEPLGFHVAASDDRFPVLRRELA